MPISNKQIKIREYMSFLSNSYNNVPIPIKNMKNKIKYLQLLLHIMLDTLLLEL